MPTWLSVVLVIVAVLVAGMMRERWRIAGIEKLARARGLRVHSPFQPDERQPHDALARRFNPHFSRRWGIAVVGVVDGVEVTVAEHEVGDVRAGKTGKWFTLVVWPVREAAGPIVIWPGAGLAPFSDVRVAERLGVPQADPATLRVQAPSGLLVEGEPALREAWLGAARVAALEAWPHGGAFVRDQGHAAWRVPGLITPGRLGTLLERVAQARRLLE